MGAKLPCDMQTLASWETRVAACCIVALSFNARTKNRALLDSRSKPSVLLLFLGARVWDFPMIFVFYLLFLSSMLHTHTFVHIVSCFLLLIHSPYSVHALANVRRTTELTNN